MWRKWLKDVPRVFKWEREDPPEHLKRFHRHGIEWGTQRYQYATVDEELWPKVVLKSEELHLRDVDSWRDAYRLHIEGHFGNLRQRHHVSVPNNYNAVQRYVYVIFFFVTSTTPPLQARDGPPLPTKETEQGPA